MCEGLEREKGNFPSNAVRSFPQMVSGQVQLDICGLSDGREEDLFTTVDGRNPAPVDRWIIPIFNFFYRVSVIQSGAEFLPSTAVLMILVFPRV